MSNKTLEAYTKAAQAVKAFKENNAKVFDTYNELMLAVSEAEQELKTDVRDNVKDNIANEFVRVTYSPSFRQRYNPDTVLSMAKPKEKKALQEAGAIKTEIDKAKFEGLVELGQVSKDIQNAAYEESPLTPRIIIKENK